MRSSVWSRADMLEDVGFQTIEVRTAAEALAVLEGPMPVSMLITGRGIVGDGVPLPTSFITVGPLSALSSPQEPDRISERSCRRARDCSASPTTLQTSFMRWKLASHRYRTSPQALPCSRAACRPYRDEMGSGMGRLLQLPRPSRTKRSPAVRPAKSEHIQLAATMSVRAASGRDGDILVDDFQHLS